MHKTRTEEQVLFLFLLFFTFDVAVVVDAVVVLVTNCGNLGLFKCLRNVFGLKTYFHILEGFDQVSF